MSSYYQETKHPKTGEWEKALWLDDKFGQHHYGVEFPSEKGKFYDPEEVTLKTRMSEANPPRLTKKEREVALKRGVELIRKNKEIERYHALTTREGWQDAFRSEFGIHFKNCPDELESAIAFIEELLKVNNSPDSTNK